MKKYENKTGWIQPPTVPFGGSQLDHKLAAEKLAANRKVKSALRDYFDEEQLDWVNPETEKKES